MFITSESWPVLSNKVCHTRSESDLAEMLKFMIMILFKILRRLRLDLAANEYVALGLEILVWATHRVILT